MAAANTMAQDIATRKDYIKQITKGDADEIIILRNYLDIKPMGEKDVLRQPELTLYNFTINSKIPL